MSKNTAKTFAKNYTVLEEIHQKLKTESITDIDELLPLIKQATSAFEACKERITQVEAALAKQKEVQEGE